MQVLLLNLCFAYRDQPLHLGRSINMQSLKVETFQNAVNGFLHSNYAFDGLLWYS